MFKKKRKKGNTSSDNVRLVDDLKRRLGKRILVGGIGKRRYVSEKEKEKNLRIGFII